MKIKYPQQLILFLIIALLSVSLAYAYPVSIQLNGNTNFNSSAYHCSNSACSSLGSPYASGSGNPISYNINNEGSGMQYFGEFDYVSDRCYVSHSYKNWFDEDTGNGPWVYDITFTKQADCQSDISSISYDSSMYQNETQDVTVIVKSPLNLNPSGPSIIPSLLEYYYSTNAAVTVKIKDGSTTLMQQTKNADILWGTSKQFQFGLGGLTNGTYTLEISSDVDDCMCSNSLIQSQQKSFVVLPLTNGNGGNNGTNNTNQLPFADFTYSPSNPNVTQIVYFDASLSHDNDGNIISYNWDFGDSSTATGVSVSHSYLLVGNYTVTLTVVDNSGGTSTMTKTLQVFNATVSQGNNQTNNNTNETGGTTIPITQPCTNSTSTKKYGDVDNVELKNFILDNGFCDSEAQISFEVFNSQSGKLNDVKVTIEIPELHIEDESQYFNMNKLSSQWVYFSLDIPRVAGTFYARINIYSDNEVNEMIYPIRITCDNAASNLSISMNQDGTIQLQNANNNAGITGNAVAAVMSNVSAGNMSLVFAIFILTALIIKLLLMIFKK
ncbi:MAG: PKD domain-containing protein [archaeon]